MQSGGAIAPELDLHRLEPIAAPIVRSRHVAASELPLVSFHRRFEIAARGERPRLLARPGADLAPSRPRGEIGVAFGRGHFGDSARGTGPGGAAISSGKAPPPAAGLSVRAPWRSRCWCRRRGRARSAPLHRTIRASGKPSASTVASVIASGSLISVPAASSSQSLNNASGSPALVKSAVLNSFKAPMLRGRRGKPMQTLSRPATDGQPAPTPLGLARCGMRGQMCE